MVVLPKIRKNICLNAHPAGCDAQVQQQIDFIRSKGALAGPRRVLVIGSSNGYGLAARITAAFGCGAHSLGVSYERPGDESRTGTAGWYNERAFVGKAQDAGLAAYSINGDAFSKEIKERVCALIREKLETVDLVVYSIASPRRLDPKTGELYSSVIKPIGKRYSSKTVDFQSGIVSDISIEPATEEEISHTVKVKGGEDWLLWIRTLLDAGVLERGVKTVAFSYLGPAVTYPIYRDGSIGKAKEDLEQTAPRINALLERIGGVSLISVNKALVTRASAVIPVVPLYLSLLYRVMKNKGIHEGCIHQMLRLFQDHLYSAKPGLPDEAGRIRLDDLEMRPDVQHDVTLLWNRIETENLGSLSDFEGFQREFLQHHGFAMPGINYEADVEP
ncbi:MAG TPA: enoyl-ACP reductase FabV [Spirochaetia bacterium]|nr:enoyl-ACP reductase FabV [Spirochaetia bacterium]